MSGNLRFASNGVCSGPKFSWLGSARGGEIASEVARRELAAVCGSWWLSVNGGVFEWRWRECSASVVGGNWRCGVWGERFVLGFVEGEGRGSDLGGVSVPFD